MIDMVVLQAVAEVIINLELNVDVTLTTVTNIGVVMDSAITQTDAQENGAAAEAEAEKRGAGAQLTD